jgi:lipid II:glycine glycyltransferase (peptidoglycan interpeptide bridge formation enzyme)
VLDLRSIDVQGLANQARSCRRQELRKAAAYIVQEEHEVDRFLALYGLTFARQGIALPTATLQLVRAIAEAAVAQGYGRISSCSTPQGVASMMLVLYDRQRAYYLFAANDPDQRNSGAATRLMFENLLFAQQRGVAEFDFVGVNSPNRGDFKLSFNPELKLYFDLRYECGVASVP